jgi:hypothetical protein
LELIRLQEINRIELQFGKIEIKVTNASILNMIQVLEDLFVDLKSAASSSITTVFNCFETRKGMYSSQVRKTREISNQATRNALQVDPFCFNRAFLL